MKPLTERYQADLLGVLSCYDRMIITGTLPGACYAGGMTSFLYSRHIEIFDYAKVFANSWRERIRQCAHELADKHGVAIEHVNKPHIRKEDLVAKIIERRGKHPGLVHILSAMEACFAPMPFFPRSTRNEPGRRSSRSRLNRYPHSSAKITPQLAQEIDSRLSTRIAGACIKHCMGSASVKIYDKFKRVPHIEMTTNDVSFLNTTARLNTGTVSSHGNSPHSKNPFTASSICARFCSAVTVATLNSYPRSMTILMGTVLCSN